VTDPRRNRLLLSPLLLLVALLTGLGLNLSSATASAGPETRVRANQHVSAVSVGETGSKSPASVRCLRPETGVFVSGSCVATEAESVAVNGETAATKLGREMHKSWDYGPGFEKEFTLDAGGRVDAINFETREVIELKPNNPRAIRLGERQVADYVAKLNEQFPGDPWTGQVVTYGP
jgi:Restriction endonuclease fold toxin 9